MKGRILIEMAIENLIKVLDEIDGDPDLEPDPVEQQNDAEADPAEDGVGDRAAMLYLLAERERWIRRA